MDKPLGPLARWQTPIVQHPRFLTLADVAEILNISGSQAYALVRTRELEAIKIGGRGQWRVESDKLEDFIRRMYDRTRSTADAPGSTGAPGPVLGEWEVGTAKE